MAHENIWRRDVRIFAARCEFERNLSGIAMASAPALITGSSARSYATVLVNCLRPVAPFPQASSGRRLRGFPLSQTPPRDFRVRKESTS